MKISQEKKKCNEYCNLVTINSIYCISLKKSVDRREHIKNESSKINKKINIYDAIDGDTVSIKQQKKIHKHKFTLFSHNPKITFSKRTLACATSHMSLLKKLKDKKENILIIEDDNYFKYPSFIKDFKNISCNLPKDWDIVFFNPDSSLTNKRKEFLIEFNNDFYLLKKTSRFNLKYTTFYTNCYLVNNNSINSIIKNIITDDIDVLLTKLFLNIYITKESWCSQYSFKSTRK